MNNGKMPFRERVVRFMTGRNGPDDLYRFIMIVCTVLIVLNLFFRLWIISIAVLILLAFGMWRCFSKNLYNRKRENLAYLRIKSGIFERIRLLRDRWRDRKTHIYRRCPECKKVLRLPRRPGKHNVCCPLCSHRFEVICMGKVNKQ